jgi:hypothetical protein
LIFPGNDEMRKIEIKLGVSMVYINDAEQKEIVTLECIGEFDVTNKVKESTKFDVIKALIDYTNWALQGIYCSKLSGSSLSMMIPPEINPTVSDDYLLNMIRDDWN